MAFSYSPKIVTDGLVFAVDAANKKSYPGSGTTWSDLAGSNDGTLTNGPTFDSGNGGSIVFDGSDDYADFGTTLSNFTTELTIEFFGKINGSPNDGILITKGEHDSSSTSNFGFQISNVGGPNRLRLYAKASGQSYTVKDSNSNIRDNNINNYTLVYNSGNIYFYKNGTLFSSHTFGLSSLPSSSGPLSIGRLKGYPNYFPGNIFSIKVYNKSLSSTEITQNYNALKSRFGL